MAERHLFILIRDYCNDNHILFTDFLSRAEKEVPCKFNSVGLGGELVDDLTVSNFDGLVKYCKKKGICVCNIK